MVLAFRRAFGCHDGGLHLRQVHLDTGKGHPRTLYACRALHNFNSGQRIDESPHQAEVAARNWFGWPKSDYEILHGEDGHPIQLRQLLHLVVQQHWVLRCPEL